MSSGSWRQVLEWLESQIRSLLRVLYAMEDSRRNGTKNSIDSHFPTLSVDPHELSWHLALWLEQQGVPSLNAALLEQLSERLALGAAGGGCDLPGGWRLQWKGDNLSLQPPATEN